MIKYISSQDIYIGNTVTLTPEEVEIADDLEKRWLQSQKRLSVGDLLAVFPEAKGAFKRSTKQKITTLRTRLNELLKLQREYSNSIYKDPANIELYQDWINQSDQDIKKIRTDLKRHAFFLSFLERPQDLPKGSITPADVERAKQAHIEDYYQGDLRKVGNTLVGLCPFHVETGPSFTIYTQQNRFYCFAENISGDSIDFIKKSQNLEFIPAVKFILHR